MTSEEFEKYKHDAVHELMDLNASCSQNFNINHLPRWDYDLDDRTLTFSEDSVPKVIAVIQVAGTTSKAAGTWMWGWANESLPSAATDAIQRVRTFGEAESVPQLASATLPVMSIWDGR